MSRDTDPSMFPTVYEPSSDEGDTMPPAAPSDRDRDREETVKIGRVHRRLDALEAQLEEVHMMKRLVGWAIPSLAVGAASFFVTASVAFYRLDRAEATITHHVEQSATTAHPGTSDALWSIRQDVQASKTLLESLAREHERELRSINQRMERMERVEARSTRP